MVNFDEIAQKRREQQAQQTADASRQQNLDAITGGSNDIIHTLLQGDEQPKAVMVTNDDIAKKDDINNVLDQLKQLHLTNLLEANKPKEPDQHVINVTDTTGYIGKSIGDLGDTIMAKLADTTADDGTKKMLTDLLSAINSLKSDVQSNPNEDILQNIKQAIDSMDIQPVVKVAAPKVNVAAPEVNLKPLQDTLDKFLQLPDDKVDLDCYRPQDINNDGNTQYIGFVNADGGWYIIENLTKKNQLRYLFGNSGYTAAFDNAASHEYMLLNEAIDALST